MDYHLMQSEASEGEPYRSCSDLYTRNRRPTDARFLGVFAAFFIVLFCFTGYCIHFGDINRIVYGHDVCGTPCGQDREFNSDLQIMECYGNFSKNLECPNSAEATMVFVTAFFKDIGLYCPDLMFVCILSLVLSLVLLLLFRFCIRVIVWIILVVVQVLAILASYGIWVSPPLADRYYNQGFAIGVNIFSVILVVVIISLRKKIDLVIQLFQEAGKALVSMPGLLLIPLLTFLALVVTMIFGVYFSLWIDSAGELVFPSEFHLPPYYRKNIWMKTAAVLNIIGVIWMYQFIIGCQHVIVAGAVSNWYFIRDKEQLTSPIAQSAYNLTKYHLGSVAEGSFLLSFIQTLRTWISSFRKIINDGKRFCCFTCLTGTCLCPCFYSLSSIETNSYVIVAMYGYSIHQAGKKAFANIIDHSLSFVTINSVGDFVLFFGKLFVVLITGAIALLSLQNKQLEYPAVAISFIGILSFFIAHCFITVYETIIDTIFMCFCEDSQLNDGISQPYYMSKGLMEYVHNSHRLLRTNEHHISQEQLL